MANIKFNQNNIRRVPINRNSLFYDAEMYSFEREIGKDYIEQDMGQTVVLYQIDEFQTQTDAIYGETEPNSIVFKTPIEIPCVYKIEQLELKSYDKTKQLGTYLKPGNLTFSFYKETIDELGVEIKKGYYVGVQVRPDLMLYYVINAVNPNYDNAHTLWGTIPLYWTCTCSYVDPSEFNG